MNDEELEDLMYRAGLTAQGCWDSMDQYAREAVIDFAKRVAAAEREACAKVCERLPETFKIVADEFGYKAETPTAENYAAAIRTRSDE